MKKRGKEMKVFDMLERGRATSAAPLQGTTGWHQCPWLAHTGEKAHGLSCVELGLNVQKSFFLIHMGRYNSLEHTFFAYVTNTGIGLEDPVYQRHLEGKFVNIFA